MSAKAPDHRSADGPTTDRTNAALYLGGALLVVLGLVAVVARLISPDEPDDSAGSPAPTSSQTPPSEPSTVATPSAQEPAGGESGAGLAVAATVISSTAIDVVESVSWPDGGPATIVLTMPDDSAAAAGLAITSEPVVDQLHVIIDGSSIRPSRRDDAANTWMITAPYGAPASMQVQYVLRGAIVRSVPATPGRALAMITPISRGAAGNLPIEISITAADVLNVYCPGADTLATIRCGHLADDRWTVDLSPGLALVVAQLDLPPPT